MPGDGIGFAFRVTLSLVLIAFVSACATETYGALGAKGNLNTGYRETRQEDGSYLLFVTAATQPDAMNYWDRRAAELCSGADYEKNIFRAERGLVYNQGNMVPGYLNLSGHLVCKGKAQGAVQPQDSAQDKAQ